MKLLFAYDSVVLLLVALLAVGAAWAAREVYLARRVEALVSAAKRLGAGDLAARANVPRSHGVIDRMAGALNQVAASLSRLRE